MSHEIETMYSVREVPWHKLGDILPDHPQTREEVLTAAGLDWTVEMQAAQTTTGIAIPNLFAVVRSTDSTILGTHTSRYSPMQNAELVNFLWTLAEPGVPDGDRIRIETAASLAEGRKVFVCARVPRDLMIGGVDAVNLYLVVSSSHDGSLAFSAAVTPIRTVCANTLNLGLARAKATWKIKHTESMAGKVQVARDALGMTFAYADEFQQTADALIDSEYMKRQFETMVRDLFPAKKTDEQIGTFSAEQYKMIGVFESSPTVDDSFRYTRWSALNAIREYDDWRPLNNTGDVAERRTEAALWGKNVDRSNAALAYLTRDLVTVSA